MFKYLICKLIAIFITDNALLNIARSRCGTLVCSTNNYDLKDVRLLGATEVKHINNKKFVSFVAVNDRTETFLEILICDSGVISMKVCNTETYIDNVKYSLYIKET